jgi:hypothetical protein
MRILPSFTGNRFSIVLVAGSFAHSAIGSNCAATGPIGFVRNLKKQRDFAEIKVNALKANLQDVSEIREAARNLALLATFCFAFGVAVLAAIGVSHTGTPKII